MERFVKSLFPGGIALVVGLWLLTLFAIGSGPWLAGAAAAALGTVGLVASVVTELEYER